MTNITYDQKQIVNWFDKTYKNRGTGYLRPVDAYRIYLSLLNTTSGEKILDIACGPGQLLKAAAEKQLDLYGIDISSEAIKQCKKRLPEANVQVANAEALPFKESTFDYITCLGSLERFLDLPKALNEMVRVSNPNAKLCFLVRNEDAPTWKLVKKTFGLQNHTGHQTAKTMETWKNIFNDANLEVENIICDQWPLIRWKRWLSFNKKNIDYSKVRKGILPLRNAYEYIFLLKIKNGQ